MKPFKGTLPSTVSGFLVAKLHLLLAWLSRLNFLGREPSDGERKFKLGDVVFPKWFGC